MDWLADPTNTGDYRESIVFFIHGFECERSLVYNGEILGMTGHADNLVRYVHDLSQVATIVTTEEEEENGFALHRM